MNQREGSHGQIAVRIDRGFVIEKATVKNALTVATSHQLYIWKRFGAGFVAQGPLFDPAACPWPRKKPQRYNTNAALHVLPDRVATVKSPCELTVDLL
ncbi:MAG: hypothetical protein ACRD1O_09975 [Terriglobia bacterium]